MNIADVLRAGVVGDAWGVPYEGLGPGKNRPFPAAGVFSDDTALTMATCEAIVESGGVETEAIAAKFVEWFRRGSISGAGSSTLKALRDLSDGAHWALAGLKGEFAAGGGAAMRVAPLLPFVDPIKDDGRRTIRDLCRITHNHDEAFAGALAVLLGLRFARQADALPVVAEYLPDTAVRDRMIDLNAYEGSVADAAAAFGSSGYVVDAVPLALFAAFKGSEREPLGVIGAVVEAGGDADTIASLAGQISAARFGSFRGEELFERIAGAPHLSSLIERFSRYIC